MNILKIKLDKLSLADLKRLQARINYLIERRSESEPSESEKYQNEKIDFVVQKLNELRDLNLTLEEIASRMHCSVPTLSKWYRYIDGKDKRPKYCKIGSYQQTVHDQAKHREEIIDRIEREEHDWEVK